MGVPEPILITGISGFIGMHLAERLIGAGAHVRGLDIHPAAPRRGLTFYRADLTIPESLDGAVRGVRTVFHCARWNGRPATWSAAQAIEVTGLQNLLEACRRAGVGRVVHLSSVTVYGPTRRAVITEETPLWPVDAYGRCKVGAERVVARALRRGPPVVTLRPGLAFGPRAYGGTINPVRRIAAGRPVLAAGGRGVAHPIYIEHLLDALLAAAVQEGIAGQAFNLADGDVSWRDFLGHYARMCRRPLRSAAPLAVWLFGLAAEVHGALTRRPPLTHRSLVHYMTRPTRFSTEKARTTLGWTPTRSLEAAMAETERWLRDARLLPA